MWFVIYDERLFHIFCVHVPSQNTSSNICVAKQAQQALQGMAYFPEKQYETIFNFFTDGADACAHGEQLFTAAWGETVQLFTQIWHFSSIGGNVSKYSFTLTYMVQQISNKIKLILFLPVEHRSWNRVFKTAIRFSTTPPLPPPPWKSPESFVRKRFLASFT